MILSEQMGHWKKPLLKCAHMMHLQMLGDIVNFAQSGLENYKMVMQRAVDEQQRRAIFPSETWAITMTWWDVITQWEQCLSAVWPPEFDDIILSLTTGKATCKRCDLERTAGQLRP